MSDSQARVEEVFAEAARLFSAKNLHYKDSWREQGWRGNLSRILEKAKRLRSMLWRGGNVLLNGSNEHPRETLLDIINTAAFCIINMDDRLEWGHETAPDYPEWVRGPGFPETSGTVDFPNEITSYANTLGDTWVPAEKVAEQTRTDLPFVGDVPTPGEENPFEERPKLSPRKRSTQVTDKGSGPRQKSNNPQA